MKRFLIFAAVAPPLGFIVAFWVMLQIANWLAGSPNTFDVAQIMMLPTIYLVGLIPALFGLIGAVPSALCSWLAAERQAPDLVPSP